MENNQVIFDNHTDKKENNPNSGGGLLSPETKRLIEKYQNILAKLEKRADVATIHVDEIASKIALVYEKIRKIIDWKEEHLIRRAAIERILKRKLISEISGLSLIAGLNPEKMAEPMVLELIRGGHFPNDEIPRTRIARVQRALEKYIHILENSPLSNGESPSNIKIKINFYNWIMEIAACEIEEILDPPLKENILIDYMTMLMDERIKLAPGIKISDQEKKIQIYIAVHHALFHLDSPIISYRLIKLRYPEWNKPSEEFLKKATANILSIWDSLEKDFNHPLSSEFHKICEKYDTVYLIIGDILGLLSKKPIEIYKKFSSKTTLKELIKKVYYKRLSTLKSRLFRAAVYSTLSIFVAGGLSLFIVEVPLAKLFYGRFSPLALAVDIIIPTVVMFILVAVIKLPKDDNFKRVVQEIEKIIYPVEEMDVYEIRPRKKRGFIGKFIIGLIYTSVSIVSMALTFWVFWIVKIPMTSLILDTLNIAMVVFAGLIIRQRAKEMTIQEKTTFWEFSLDLLSIPLGKLGQWLSKKWREYNIVSVFFTALVDLPFSTIVEFIESFNLFLKEKKAEIQQ